MAFTIYQRGSILVREIIDCDDSSEQSITLMAEDAITLKFKTAYPVFIQIGDFGYFFNVKYTVNQVPEFIQTSTREYAYTLVLESQAQELGQTDFLFLNSVNQFEDAIFDFRGTPIDYGNLLIYNLTRDFPTTKWQLGTVVVADFASQSFSCTNCLDALKTIATLFQTEYLIEGNVISIVKRQIPSGITLQYGQNNALISIQQQNQTTANLITRLRVFGSTKNITPTYRDGSPRLRMPATIGDVLTKNLDTFGLYSKTIVFDGTTNDVKTGLPLPEIYPHRTGTITAIEPDTTTNYFLIFYDADIPFDVNTVLISGVTAQVEFQSGFLSGYTFDIVSFDNSTKKFTIKQNTNEANLIVPSATTPPLAGDQYVVLNISQPDEYLTAAEEQLQAAGEKYLIENCIPPLVFTNVLNPVYIKKHGVSFLLGQLVGLISDPLKINVSLRVISIQRNIRNPNIITIKLADSVNLSNILAKIINK